LDTTSTSEYPSTDHSSDSPVSLVGRPGGFVASNFPLSALVRSWTSTAAEPLERFSTFRRAWDMQTLNHRGSYCVLILNETSYVTDVALTCSLQRFGNTLMFVCL